MDNNWIAWVIVGMSLVTAIPRLLPFIINTEKYLPNYALTGLKFVPVAALTALVIPGIVFVNSSPFVGVMGGLVAVILSLLPRSNMIVTVIASFLAALLVTNFS